MAKHRRIKLEDAGRKLRVIVEQLARAPEGRIALTREGRVEAWLMLPERGQPAEERHDEPPPRNVARLVKRALKAARE